VERIARSLLRIPVGPVVAAVAVAGIWMLGNTPDAAARVPELRTLNVNTAIAKAAHAGYFTNVSFRKGGGIAGTVVAQRPEPRVVFDKHSTIVLVVTRGAAQVKVPDVRHLPVDEARRRIDRGNLRVGHVTYRRDPELEPDRVIATRPKQNTLVDAYSTVDIVAAD
jgi:beta-lactam-binding protein with PASTA domain